MKRFVILALLLVLIAPWAAAAAQNPFTSDAASEPAPTAPMVKSPVFVKIIVWQQQLREKMSALIRAFRGGEGAGPLLVLMGLAFAYGAIHAAGPGHGKAVAISYVLSHRPTLVAGLLFGLGIALIHACSGIVGVVGLRYLIERSVSETLASVTTITEIVSFSLILLLGLAIVVKQVVEWVRRKGSASAEGGDTKKSRNLWLWALAVGVVPCPAVVMVMLFCLSMDALVLGLLLAGCIAAGMGATLSTVAGALVLGKAGVMRAVPESRFQLVEGVVGLASGAAVATFGAFFLIATINSVVH